MTKTTLHMSNRSHCYIMSKIARHGSEMKEIIPWHDKIKCEIWTEIQRNCMYSKQKITNECQDIYLCVLNQS